MPRNISSDQLIRYVVGYVFIASALMKLVVADFTVAFSNFGIPYPEIAVLIVGVTELICGVLIIFNYYVKKAAIPLLVIIVAAILFTKLPVLQTGLLEFAFEARLDFVMLVLLFILWKK
ncbi:DoxX family protein [Gracilibacillus sp. D59]|uniref:DoxX family protein n=1 Tax=Gracilibacillus sp. D59 TaxID=3457434 RepID=UPI003FCE4702